MTLSIVVGIWALAIIVGICLNPRFKKTPRYLTICGHELKGVGVCQRNGGHGGGHAYVTWPKP